jgi:membrane protease YdiL (CAAX protease family)
MWLWSMLFLTALPEEALFRGVVQTGLVARAGEWQGLTAAAVLFGVAHAGGGVVYVLLSIVAGAGYGWIYLRTRSIAGSILAHTALNSAHLLLFTYPALASRAGGV